MSKKKSKKKENNGISSMTSPSQAGKTKYQLTRAELMELILQKTFDSLSVEEQNQWIEESHEPERFQEEYPNGIERAKQLEELGWTVIEWFQTLEDYEYEQGLAAYLTEGCLSEGDAELDDWVSPDLCAQEYDESDTFSEDVCPQSGPDDIFTFDRDPNTLSAEELNDFLYPSQNQTEEESHQSDTVDVPYDENQCKNWYSIDGNDFFCRWQLFHDRKLIGWVCDAEGFQTNRKFYQYDMQTHIDALLDSVRKNRIELLLVYYTKGDRTIWDVYVRGHYVRTHNAPPSYEGYLFDKAKMTAIYQLEQHSPYPEIPYGPLMKCLNRFTRQAYRTLQNEEEIELRADEIAAELNECADAIERMQKNTFMLRELIHKMKLSPDEDGFLEITQEDLDTIHSLLNTYADSIPQAILANYEIKARRTFPCFDSVTALSQKFLITAVSLEMSLNSEEFDVCPVYIELCRVFENELDNRIFNEYLAALQSEKVKYTKERSFPNDEKAFQALRNSLEKSGKNPVFVAERIKLTLLCKLNESTPNSSRLRRKLYSHIEEKKFCLDGISSETDCEKNCKYVEQRNTHVHPMDLQMEEELRNLQDFKIQTNQRLSWLIDSTTPNQENK